MQKIDTSIKRMQINKAGLTVVASVGIATFLVVFVIVAGRALLIRSAYQARVIEKQEIALDTVNQNKIARDSLVEKYQDFIDQDPNIISGQLSGDGDRDGDNAKITLDSLPSKYDFPALASSIEKLVTLNGSTLLELSGQDDEVKQQDAETGPNAEPIEMPFELGVKTDYEGAQRLIDMFDKSIRPVHVDLLTISGGDNDLDVSISARTYYQPQSGMRYTREVVE